MTIVRYLAVKHLNCAIRKRTHMLRVRDDHESLPLFQVKASEQLHDLVFV